MDDAPRLKEYEDLLLALDGTLADMEAAKRKGYLARDLPLLRNAADAIRDRRRMDKPTPKAITALRLVKEWHRKAPIDELERVEAAIGENFPQAAVDDALEDHS
jgi:hypothetical protein